MKFGRERKALGVRDYPTWHRPLRGPGSRVPASPFGSVMAHRALRMT